MYYRPRRPPPAPKAPDEMPASLAIMAPEFEAKEWGDVGEFVTGGDGVPPPPPKPIIPPPDWEAEERERLARERVEHGLDEELPGQHPPPEREPS
jgi:hypothetical protein